MGDPMSKGHRLLNAEDEKKRTLWAKARDYSDRGHPMVRSATRHDLMDLATKYEDNELWGEIAEHVLDAMTKDNDLSAKVSDHFVRDCPESVFLRIAERSLQHPRLFAYWRRRARNLLQFHERRQNSSY